MTVEKITAVTVTYGDRSELCIQTVRRAIEAGAESAVIVLNGVGTSARQSLQSFVENDRQISIVFSESNEGSAAGFSLGIARAIEDSADFIWLLDDDNFAEADALKSLFETYNHVCKSYQRSSIAICALRASNAVHNLVASGVPPGLAYPRPGSFVYLDLIQRLRRRSDRKSRTHSGAIEVPYAPYGGLLFHRTSVSNVGYPNGVLVLYEDDTEFTSRFRLHGGGVFLAPGAVISDGDDKWTRIGSGRGPERLITAGNRTRLHYSLRNRAFFDIRRATSTSQRCSLALNGLVFIGYLVGSGVLKRKFRELAIALCALWQGATGDFRSSPALQQSRDFEVTDTAVSDRSPNA